MSKKKFLEERAEVERKHLEYLRETRAKHLEKRDRMGVEYDCMTDTYSVASFSAPPKSGMASMASGYTPDYTTGTRPYDGPGYAWDSGPTTTIKYLTLEEAMKLHREEEARRHYIVTREDATKWVKHGSASWMETGAPVRIEKNIRVAALSDGTYPEVGMRVVHDGVTFEIERIEIETPSWCPVAVGHAVGDMDTFVVGRLYMRAPLDELQPAKAKENVA